MLVKQRLRINNTVLALSVVAMIAVLLLTGLRVIRAMEQNQIVDSILATSFERLLLRTDNHQTGSERSRTQLLAKHKQVGSILRTALHKFTASEDKNTVKELLDIHESIGKLAKTISDNQEKRGQLPPDAITQEMEYRLNSQLNMRAYESILLNGKLQESSKAALVSALKQGGGAISLVLLLVGTVILINSTMMNRTIADRISGLRNEVAIIGSGNLDHRINIHGDDEFAELAAAFDEMTDKLKDSYSDLENEVKERRQAEEALQKAHNDLARQMEERTRELREKEVLLKEVHHRVKNNLQVISSLVGLQTEGAQDETVREVLREVTWRVRSMALVHEKLYQSANLARIDFGEYSKSLLNNLWRAHGNAAAAIRLTFDLEPVSLPVDTAVPCGLILNELACNALKHAFLGRDAGVVAVSLQRTPDGLVSLSLRDNGVGLPHGLDWRQARSLGLRLVQMLAGQLNATMELDRRGGTEFRITFILPETAKDGEALHE